MRCLVLAACIGLVLGFAGNVGAQDNSGSKSSTNSNASAPPGKSDSAKDESKGKVTGRLPANYGRLGLSDDQKQQIYRIQAKYAAKLEELEKEIEKAKVQRIAECLKVLTKIQKERLEELKNPKDKNEPEKK